MRAVVAGIVHESSTFATEVLGPVAADHFSVFEGDRLIEEFRGTNTCVGGYLDACADGGVEAVPVLHARAEPAGSVAPEVYRTLEERLLAGLPATCDVALLDLHGAGLVGTDSSLDLRLLRAVRSALPAAIIAAVMDLHANLSDEIVGLTDVLVGFNRYPHTDMAERAARSARIALAAVAGTVRPRVRNLRLPMVLPPSTTDSGPGRELADLSTAAEQKSGVLACTVFHGFPYADTPQTGTSVVTVTDGDPELGDSVNRRVADWLWHNRSRFLRKLPGPAAAVREALAVGHRPVVIGDAADNPGGGATGDGTDLLRALLATDARCCLATVHDPTTVGLAVAAGVGNAVDVRLGGAHGIGGPPVHARATVRAITDGRVVQQSMRRGKPADFGRSVRLTIDNVDLIVSTNRLQVLDPEILLLHGVVPQRYDIVAVKSTHHFRAGFAHVTGHALVADGQGLTSCRIESIPRHGPSARLWPMNSAAMVPEGMEDSR